VVAFVKGTRSQPQCGFSYKMLQARRGRGGAAPGQCRRCSGARDAVGSLGRQPPSSPASLAALAPPTHTACPPASNPQILNDMKADYEVVNVLDEFHNPGLRDAIKTYSAWPTIPQLYIGGEFVGGADIVEQMVGNGELQQMLRP
jgi:glutaredoxin-related protein